MALRFMNRGRAPIVIPQVRQPAGLFNRPMAQNTVGEVVDTQLPAVNESAESVARTVVTGRQDSIFSMTIENTAEATAYDALFLDPFGNIAAMTGHTNNAAIEITSQTHSYAAFLNTLKNASYKVRKIVFKTSTADEGQLDTKVRFMRYENANGVANTFDSVVPSSGINANQYNLNVYEHFKNWILDSEKGGLVTMSPQTTLTIIIHFQ
jgi:hypothetical protein